jgi:hypothetical protein
VMEIAAKHGAKVSIEDARPHTSPPGALFTVRLDTAPAPASTPRST